MAGAEVLALIGRTLAEAGAVLGAGARPVALVTAEAKAGEPGLVTAAARLGLPLRAYGAGALAGVAVPDPSAVVLAAVGVPGVAEAAALLAAGRAGAGGGEAEVGGGDVRGGAGAGA
ncbi:cobalamin biosynthesis protein [Streptomyces eurocidicus]|uniref:cobalamin biosynthesis protein n=1 Tax=Streptomyces eurocidicus TaxID=66423 RepID=UPI003CC81421